MIILSIKLQLLCTSRKHHRFPFLPPVVRDFAPGMGLILDDVAGSSPADIIADSLTMRQQIY